MVDKTNQVFRQSNIFHFSADHDYFYLVIPAQTGIQKFDE
jgi:hypothetical protein